MYKRQTGYTWVVDQKPDASVLRYTGFNYEKVPNGSPPGTPQQQTLKFEGVGPGEVELTLNYVSPGDGSVEESKTGTVIVK